jgi:hypothetical protein
MQQGVLDIVERKDVCVIMGVGVQSKLTITISGYHDDSLDVHAVVEKMKRLAEDNMRVTLVVTERSYKEEKENESI